jgi:hypothetical protein
MKKSRFWGWEIQFPKNFILQQQPLGLRMYNHNSGEVLRANINPNRSAAIDVKSPIHLEVNLSQQQLTIRPID